MSNSDPIRDVVENWQEDHAVQVKVRHQLFASGPHESELQPNRHSKLNLVWVCVAFVTVTLLNSIFIKIAAEGGISPGVVLVCRGCGCIFMVLMVAFARQEIPVVANLKLQAKRFALSGLILTLMILSYYHANASTIQLINLSTVPLLILFAPTESVRVSPQQKRCSAICIILIILMSVFFRHPEEEILGYLLAAVVSMSTALGFTYLHQTVKTEQLSTTICVPAIASILVGCGLLFSSWTSIDFGEKTNALLLSLMSGATMYTIYYIVTYLYSLIEIYEVDSLSGVAILFLIPIEFILVHDKFSLSHVLACIVTVFFIYFTIYIDRMHRIWNFD